MAGCRRDVEQFISYPSSADDPSVYDRDKKEDCVDQNTVLEYLTSLVKTLDVTDRSSESSSPSLANIDRVSTGESSSLSSNGCLLEFCKWAFT